jgi:acyl-CoA synthetase (AMP-forming)/AMP-acid ligase II
MFPRAAFYTAYGMTEAASTITWRTLWRAGEDVRVLEPHAEGAHPSALGCVGHPVPNTELLIMASTERQAGVGEEGEVWVR